MSLFSTVKDYVPDWVVDLYQLAYGITMTILANLISMAFSFLPTNDAGVVPDPIEIHKYGNEENPMLIFIHGFPDNASVWDRQISLFQNDYYCVTLTIPNYNTKQVSDKYGFDFIPVCNLFCQAILSVYNEYCEYNNTMATNNNNHGNSNNSNENNGNNSGNGNNSANNRGVTLIMHDFGCIYGYLTYKKNMKLQSIISNIVFIEIADVDTEFQELPLFTKLSFILYQFALIAFFYLPELVGKLCLIALTYLSQPPLIYPNPLTRWGEYSNLMCYSYVYKWKRMFGALSRGTVGATLAAGERNEQRVKDEQSAIDMTSIAMDKPIYYAYSKQFPIPFGSEEFKERLNGKEDCVAKGYNSTHWPQWDGRSYKVLNDDLKRWLAQR